MSKAIRKQRPVGGDKSPLIAELPTACADETAAVELIERLRWGSEPWCPHCASLTVYRMTERATGERSKRFLWRCRGCGKQFTVRVGSVLEDSKVPLRHWAYAIWRAATSKKGVSALEIKRQTGLTYKSALFLMHRVREAMATNWTKPPKMEGTVEADEMYVGGRRRNGATRAEHYRRKAPVVALLERGVGVRAMPVEWVDSRSVGRVLAANLSPQARLMTDSAAHFTGPGKAFASHETVNHEAGEYARGDVTTNRVEGFFSLLRRALYGTWHNVSRHHLHRYVSEAEFRYNHRALEDGQRVEALVRATVGKRLTYRAVPERETA